MKIIALTLAALFALSLPAHADVYQSGALAAPGTLVLQTATVADKGAGGSGTAVVTVAGSPTTPAFSIQGSSDLATVAEASATWTALPACPVAGGPVVTSMSGTGKWAVNVAGMTRVRVNLTAIAGGSMTVTMDGGPVGTCGQIGGGTINVVPGGVTITQTIVTLTAATSLTLAPANANRKYLKWCNSGAAPMTVAPGAVTVTAGQGVNYDPGTSPSNQGGCETMESSAITHQAFSAISAAGTNATVWEGQ